MLRADAAAHSGLNFLRLGSSPSFDIFSNDKVVKMSISNIINTPSIFLVFFLYYMISGGLTYTN